MGLVFGREGGGASSLPKLKPHLLRRKKKAKKKKKGKKKTDPPGEHTQTQTCFQFLGGGRGYHSPKPQHPSIFSCVCIFFLFLMFLIFSHFLQKKSLGVFVCVFSCVLIFCFPPFSFSIFVFLIIFSFLIFRILQNVLAGPPLQDCPHHPSAGPPSA